MEHRENLIGWPIKIKILTEASSLVKFEYPITTEYYDCWINEVPRRKINPNQSLLSQQIQSRTMIYAEEK